MGYNCSMREFVARVSPSNPKGDQLMNRENLFFTLCRLVLAFVLVFAAMPLPAEAVLEQGRLVNTCRGGGQGQNVQCISSCFYDQTRPVFSGLANRRWECPNSIVKNLCGNILSPPDCHNHDYDWCATNGPFNVELSCPVQDSEDPDLRICGLDEMYVYETHKCVPRTDNPGTESSSSSSDSGTHSDTKAATAGIVAFAAVKFLTWLTPTLPAGVSLRPHANVDFRNGTAFTAANVTAEWRNFRVSAASSHNGYGWSRPSGRLDWRVEWAF